MRRVWLEKSWPQSWKESFAYDLQEVYGEAQNQAYATAYRLRMRWLLNAVSDTLGRPATLIDIAAAQGNFTLTLAELGYDVTWNDLRDDLADYVRLKQDTGSVSFVPGNIFDLEFPREFDGAIATEVIEHVAHPDAFLKRVASLVRPGGAVFLTTPNGAFFRNQLPKFSACQDAAVYEQRQFKPDADGHIFLLHPDELPTLAARSGLEIEDLHLFSSPLSMGHLKTRYVLPYLPKWVIDTVEWCCIWLLPWAIKKKILSQIGVRFRKRVAYLGGD